MADSQSQSIESLLQQGICLHLAGLCPHSLFRFHPEFDEIIAAILQGDPAGIVVLREGHYPPLTKRLKERFFQCDAIPPPRLGYADYLCVMLLADVMLDPLHFGGGKTSLDALSLGVPIVTLPGKFMRGRATFGCYRKM